MDREESMGGNGWRIEKMQNRAVFSMTSISYFSGASQYQFPFTMSCLLHPHNGGHSLVFWLASVLWVRDCRREKPGFPLDF